MEACCSDGIGDLLGSAIAENERVIALRVPVEQKYVLADECALHNLSADEIYFGPGPRLNFKPLMKAVVDYYGQPSAADVDALG
ncbi:hypothetical protein AHAS_Ahas19G0284900 [Arachis hypogaea]